MGQRSPTTACCVSQPISGAGTRPRTRALRAQSSLRMPPEPFGSTRVGVGRAAQEDEENLVRLLHPVSSDTAGDDRLHQEERERAQRQHLKDEAESIQAEPGEIGKLASWL